jgi:hypothetical protein
MTDATKLPEPAAKPKTLDEAFAKMADVAEGNPEQVLADVDEPAIADDDALGKEAEDPKDPNAIPPWLVFPEDPKWRIPPYKQIGIMKFKKEWCEDPSKGDRVCILWSLTDAEEKLASKRTRGDNLRTLAELSKMTIRACGTAGQPLAMADWTGKMSAGNIDRFWNEIGPKCRVLVTNYYYRTHSLTTEETADFFVNGLVVRSAVAG